MDKKSKLLIIFFVLIIVVSVFLTYQRSFVKKNFSIEPAAEEQALEE